MTETNRIETGIIQFSENNELDWPGIYIRGDDCYHYKVALDRFLDKIQLTEDVSDVIMYDTVVSLYKLLSSSNMNDPLHSREKTQRVDIRLISQGDK